MSMREYILKGRKRLDLFISRLPFGSDAVFYYKGTGIDKIGVSGSEVGRECVRGAYFPHDGTRAIRLTDYISTALTYVDHATKIIESGATDVNGDFLIPVNGADSITIDGYTTYGETGNQDTKVEFRNSDGDTIQGEIQNATGSDRVVTDAVEGEMDKTGYTESRALSTNIFDYKYVSHLLGDYGEVVDLDGVSALAITGNASILSKKISEGQFSENVRYTIKTRTKRAALSDQGGFFKVFYTDASNVSIIFPVNDQWEEKIYTSEVGKTIEYISFSFGVMGATNYYDVDVTQLESGVTPTTFEKYEGYSYTPDMLSPVPFFKKSTTVNGKCGWYTTASTPDFADAQFIGKLKANATIIGDDITQLTTVYRVSEAAKTLTNDLYDRTDPDNLVPLTQSISALPNIDNNQRFINKSPYVDVLYKNARTEEEAVKVGKKLA